MKHFLRTGKSRRWGHDGWALMLPAASRPMDWTVSTTREEVREIWRELKKQDLAWQHLNIVKVRINIEPI